MCSAISQPRTEAAAQPGPAMTADETKRRILKGWASLCAHSRWSCDNTVRAMATISGLLKPVAVIASIAYSALTGGIASPARAGDMPVCSGQNLGAASCFSGKLCECIYDRGGSVTGIPDGFRWDCGILRPKCGEAADAPANPDEFSGPYPLAVGIDRWDNDERVRQDPGGRRPIR